ncbi:unnamed protein product, partial [Tilletia caries]
HHIRSKGEENCAVGNFVYYDGDPDARAQLEVGRISGFRLSDEDECLVTVERYSLHAINPNYGMRSIRSTGISITVAVDVSSDLS